MSKFELTYRCTATFMFSANGLGLWLADQPELAVGFWLIAGLQAAMMWISIDG